MRRARLGRLVTIVVTLSVLFGTAGSPVPGVRADTLSDRINAAKAHQADLQRSIDRQRALLQGLHADENVAKSALSTTSDQLNAINVDQAALRKQVQTATDALHRVQSRRDSLRADLRQLDWTLSLLEEQILQGTEDLQAQQRALGARLADAYRSQQTSLLEQVLSSSSFTDVLSQASAYLSLGQQDADMASTIANDQASLDSLRRLTVATRYRTDQLRRDAESAEAELIQQQASLNQAQAKLNALETQTKAIQGQQTAAWNKINDTQGKINAALAQDLKDQASMQAKVKDMVAQAQREAARQEAARLARQHQQHHPQPQPQPNGGGGTGQMIWPAAGVVTQEFGCTGFPWEPPLGSCAHFHQGIDIANAQGTPIHAAAAGVIAFVGWGDGGAFMVIIGHSNGLETWYGHLQARQVVRRGQYVGRGQLIGYMGTTGHSTGPHLHWAVYRGGVTPLNPRNYL